MININIILVLFLIFIGCAPIPTVEHKEQKITSLHTSEYKNIVQTRNRLNKTEKLIYIYIDKDGAVNDSGAGAGELPPRMRRQLISILSDFGKNIKIITQSEVYIAMRKQLKDTASFYALDGAITIYDKDIMSQSSGINFGFDFGGGDGSGNSNSNFKDKDKRSILGVDFYLRQNEIITNSVKSRIDVKSTTRGYNFGISINKGGFGLSGYKTIQDGIGLSVRTLLEKSMNDLINQITS
jgi:biopolymer transport protein ExbD